jgi:hypothetical protein
VDIQTRIANALADFDSLLVQGLTLEAALRIAAAENQVSEKALATRASRGASLDERRRQVLTRAEVERQAASGARVRMLEQWRQAQRGKSRSGRSALEIRDQLKFDF